MKITILGPGSWGLTIAWLLSSKPYDINVWGLPEFINPIQNNRNVQQPVKVNLSDKIFLTSCLEEAASGADLILFVVPSEAVRKVSQQLKLANLNKNSILVNLAKGFELSTQYRMSEVLSEEFPESNIATLSGPTLATEILNWKPTAAVIGCKDLDVATHIQQSLHVEDMFRLYTNKDIIGVELGGSLKNVIAISTGFAYALNLGHNAIGAIITRGLAEIVRISIKLGANPSTLYGLSGIGDLIATCNSPDSRNYKVGFALGQGKTLNEILINLGAVAEGVKTTEAICLLAKKMGVEMPISNVVLDLLGGRYTPKEAIENIMKRQLKPEELYNFVE